MKVLGNARYRAARAAKNSIKQSSISPSTIGEPKKLGLVLKSHGDKEEAEGDQDAPDDGREQVDGHVAVGKYQPLRLLQLLIQKAFGKYIKDPPVCHKKAGGGRPVKVAQL